MPKVQTSSGTKKFPYTPAGKAAAAKAMKPKGKPMNGKLPTRKVPGPRI